MATILPHHQVPISRLKPTLALLVTPCTSPEQKMWKKLESTFRHVAGGSSPQTPGSAVATPPKIPIQRSTLTADQLDLRQVLFLGQSTWRTSPLLIFAQTVEYGAWAGFQSSAAGQAVQACLAFHPLLKLLAVASAGRVKMYKSPSASALHCVSSTSACSSDTAPMESRLCRRVSGARAFFMLISPRT